MLDMDSATRKERDQKGGKSDEEKIQWGGPAAPKKERPIGFFRNPSAVHRARHATERALPRRNLAPWPSLTPRPTALKAVSTLTGGKAGTMAKKERTSTKVASKAAKLLSNPNTSKAVRSVAASALTQVQNKGSMKR